MIWSPNCLVNVFDVWIRDKILLSTSCARPNFLFLFNNENISNKNLVVSNDESYEEILESVLNGSGKKAHIDVVALNAALVVWVAGIEDDFCEGFKKSLFSMSKAKPWDKLLLLKSYLK